MEAMEGERPVEREERVEEVRDERLRERDMAEGRQRSTSPRLSTLVTTYCLSPCGEWSTCDPEEEVKYINMLTNICKHIHYTQTSQHTPILTGIYCKLVIVH